MSNDKTVKYEDVLNRDGKLIYTNVGTSMMPLLREHRDLMIIEKKSEGRCKKYDAVLYKRKSGKYVLHRILKVRKDDYVICGDHCCRKEYGITDEQILGILTGVVRDGKTINVTDKNYLFYVHLWCDFFYIRIFLLYAKRIAKSILKKIIKPNDKKSK